MGGECMYQVMDVARFIVNYSIEIRKPVSNLKLQKLLYFVQVTFLGQLGVPCYTEPVVHWRHGPVVECVYQKYRSYGADSITDQELEYYEFQFDLDTMSVTTQRRTYREDIFENYHLNLIRSVVEKYQDVSPWEMVDLTHQEAAWMNTDRNEEITIDMMKKYYH